MTRSRTLSALAALFTTLELCACTFSRTVSVTSDPPGARVWLGREPVGPTPARVTASATGPMDHHTFQPEYVTLRLPGYREEVRQLPYAWSTRNVLLSLPIVLGVPGILLWSKLPMDLHVVLEPEIPADR